MPFLLEFTVNDMERVVAVDPGRTLLEVLRYDLRLIGTKQGCDTGDCGACTVQLDGEPVLSCLMLAVQAEGRRIRTVEGLGGGLNLHPLQDSFDRYNAAQCGFCTPGILLTADALLRANPSPTREEVKGAISGNLCRCTGYTKILDAILDVVPDGGAQKPDGGAQT